MMSNLALAQMASNMSAYAAERHNVIARNIANADTPGYRSLDLPPYSNDGATNSSTFLKATRSQHISTGPETTSFARLHDTTRNTAQNGNSVSLEAEMIRMAENRENYDRALAVYRSTTNVLRTSIGRG
ncbi:MAG: FlgB family protein [Pseudomonadota bacterium]